MPSLFVIRGNDQGVRFELEDEILQIVEKPSMFSSKDVHTKKTCSMEGIVSRNAAAYILRTG